jgi:hypothetical protein
VERGAGKGEPGIKVELLVEEDVVGIGQSLEVGDPVLEDVLLLHEEEEMVDEVMQELDEVFATVDLDGGEVVTYTILDGKLRNLSQAFELFRGDGKDLQALFLGCPLHLHLLQRILAGHLDFLTRDYLTLDLLGQHG